MPEPQVRLAQSDDAAAFVELVVASLGSDYPAKEVYDPAWVASQLSSDTGQETWVADVDGVLQASVSFLRATESNNNPVLNLGRNLHRPESLEDGSSQALLEKINALADERGQTVVVRVLAQDQRHQALYETLGYSCVGFQPFKHMLQNRAGVLFYVREAGQVLTTRMPLSESLSQISELAAKAFENLKISNPLSIRDGATGYPLQTELKLHEASAEDYQLWRMHSLAANPPVEISGTFNFGFGLMRITSTAPVHSVLAQRENTIVAGLAYYLDEHDRCVRLVDGFSTDDVSMGALMLAAAKSAQEQFSAVYIEVDVLATATRLLKTAEQLGFVPVAYLPAFYAKQDVFADVVKLVKLNMAYALDGVELTAHARSIVEVVDRNFEDQKVGVAIVNLLRGLPTFNGLGDGELRKIARLFTQKLFRPGERIFRKGDSGDEAYVVMRGQVDIHLEEESKPIASVTSGKVFGELAFLDGAPRNAFAIASQPSILLMVSRGAMTDLVQREPHLGMIVMRNIAIDLSNKLRLANNTIATLKAK